MKYFNVRFTLFGLLFFCVNWVSAQVNVTATGGTSSASYSTLGAAFTAINSGTHTGVITIGISANTSESASALLNASGSGSASYTTITITPTGGGARTITGAVAGDLIDLSGADNVKIDGLNTGGNSLTIANSSTGTTGSAIRFINDAQSDTITNCTVTSSHTSASYGTIMFATSAGGTGNDNNAITNCTIAETGTNLPAVGIYCGGTAILGQENSSITISGCNIANYFNAGLLTNGIFVSTGGTGWTISSNKFYQTSSSTYTTANTINAISVQTGNGYTISSNTIGYASSSGTGTYTITGTIAIRFVGINLNVGTTSTSSVQGNTITAISVTTTSGAATANGILCGISVSGGNVNIGTVTGNTIGASSGTGALSATPSTTQGMLVGINASSASTVSIQNNTIGSFACIGSAASIAGNVTGIYVGAAASSMTISNNTIGNSTSQNMVAGSNGTTTGNSIASGIFLASTPALATISGNTVQNIASYGTGTAGYVRGIQTAITSVGSAVWTVSGNTIRNLTTTGAITTPSSGQCAANGMQIAGPGVSNIYNNTIYNIGYSGTASTNIVACGIGLAAGSATVAGPSYVYGNLIYNITNTGTSTSATLPSVATGIVIRSGNNVWVVHNNMISLGNGQTTNTSFIGIFANHGSSPIALADYIYFNTVNIEGTVTSGALASSCFNRGDLTATARTVIVDVRNNIFTNTRSGGTGKHYAISENLNATATASGWGTNASNYNVLNANSSTIGYWSADKDFSSWKTSSASDANSFSGITVTYANSANDLHLNMGTSPNYMESNAQTISGFNTDFDGGVRPGPVGSTNGGAVAPDIGADEFDGVYQDNQPPGISYTGLTNTGSTSNRTVSSFATITDALTGVNTTAGTKPRLYYKKSTDNNTFGANNSSTNGWKYVEASNSSSPFSFTIDYGIINGGSVSTGTVIQYFVVAQDLYSTPNVACNPSTGFSGTAVGTISSAPTTPNSYTVATALSTTLTVGTGQTYTSLTGAGGLFAAINAAALGGNTTVTVVSDLSEDGTNALSYTGMAGYSLTIVPNSSTLRVISNSTTLAQAMIRLDGAPGVTFDGRFSGSGQYLRIVNTHTTAASCYPTIQLQNGATGTSIRNCIMESNTGNVLFGTVQMGSGTNGLTVKACDLRDAVGTPGTAGAPNAAIYSSSSTNTITVGGSTAADGNNIYNFTGSGVLLSSIADGATIQYNNLYQTASRSTALLNVYVGTGSNHTISNNNIYQTTGTLSGAGFAGIYVIGSGNGHTINNNSIGGSNASRSGAGITLTGAAASPYYNSGIYLTGGTGTASSIQGNTISNIGSTYASGVGGQIYGIIVSSGNVNIGTVTGNTVGGGATASDTIMNMYDNGLIVYAGGNTANIENNNLGNTNYYRAGADRNAGITISGPGTVIIKNNTIHDLKSNSTGVTTTAFEVFGILLNAAIQSNSNIEGNTIYNIENTNTGTTAYVASGIRVTANFANSGVTIQRNKIYNIKVNGTGTGTSAPEAQGIYITSTVFAVTVANNEIHVGTGVSGEAKAYGIYDNTSGNHNYYYNSIYLTGSLTAGSNNSYCFYRASSGSPTLRNNIFYNGRTTAGTGNMYAIGSVSTGLTATNLNYNLAIVPDTAKLVEMPSGTVNGWAAIGTLFSSGSNSNIVELSSNVSASNLFNAPGTYDLNINSGNAACWYANGRGLQLSGQTADYSSSSASRSTTVANGGTDIGADEFTPSVNPPDVTVSGTHSASGTEVFTFAGRTVASITWGSGGTLPTLTGYKYWPGTTPPDPTNNGSTASAKYMNAYWAIDATGGSGYTYSLTLNYDEALLGTITSENNTLFTKKVTGSNGTWVTYSTTLNSSGNTMTVSGLTSFSQFTGSDNTNPLPVKWLSFTGKKVFENVQLNWTTAGEINNSHFEIERSVDMRSFVSAGSITGKGTTNEMSNYQFVDVNPFGTATTVYYRLKQVDFNGDFEYSSVIAVSKGKAGDGVTIETINPNPFTQQLKVTLNNVSEGNVAITVCDINGKVLYTHSQNTGSGKLVIDLKDLSNLPEGVYILSVTNGSETIKQKLVKVQ